MRRRIWQFLWPIHHDFSEWSSMVAAVLRALRELSEPCMHPLQWTREWRGQTKSFGHGGNTRRQRSIRCCSLWPSARRFWPGLHLLTTENNVNPTLLFVCFVFPYLVCFESSDLGEGFQRARPVSKKMTPYAFHNFSEKFFKQEWAKIYLI